MEMYETDPDWAPSLHLGHTQVKATDPGRFERRIKRLQAAAWRNAVAVADPVTAAPSLKVEGGTSLLCLYSFLQVHESKT